MGNKKQKQTKQKKANKKAKQTNFTFTDINQNI